MDPVADGVVHVRVSSARYIQSIQRYAPEASFRGEWWITTRLREKPGVKRFWVFFLIGVVSAALIAVVFVGPSGFPLSSWGLLIFVVFAPISCVGTAVAGYAAGGVWRSLWRTRIREHSAGVVFSVLVGTVLGAAVIVSGWFVVIAPHMWGWWDLIFLVGPPLLAAAYMLKSTLAPLPAEPMI